MRLVRFRAADGRPQLGTLVDGRVYALAVEPAGDTRALIARGRAAIDQLAAAAVARGSGAPVEALDLISPIGNPGKLLAVAGGFYTSGEEERLGPDALPLIFAKRTDDIAGPGDPITIWKVGPGVIDEIEVGIVIGEGGRRIAPERAMDHVFGYTIVNDVSGRELDVPPPGRREATFDGFMDWLNGKWLDGYAIMGPAIVTADEAGDLSDVRIVSRVSGEVRVEGSTRNVNIPWPDLIAYASRLMTLNPGDVISTGMPHGTHEEIYLKPGDTVEGEIEGLGVLRNPVVAES
jgi:2-keto-4-pentenoate hydratase/2-oxohepta-3-ene-1,7-dioic acid hydratase in catechol pathway